jgi:hypothetical protein
MMMQRQEKQGKVHKEDHQRNSARDHQKAAREIERDARAIQRALSVIT